MTLTPEESARYARHLTLVGIGPSGQERLKAARVLIIGAGGLGSPAALYLAAAGVGTLGLVDHDTVDVTNLQRQILFGTPDLGRPKVEAGRERLLALNPLIRVDTHAQAIRASNARALLAGYDVVLDGTDRLQARYLINDACVLQGRPLVSAAIHRFEGQAMTYLPQQGPCYRCLFAESAEDLVPNCAEAGVLGVLPGLMGMIQATEAIKLITGIGTPLLGRLLVYDALSLRFSEFRFRRRKDCAVCGDAPTIRELVDPAVLPEPEIWSMNPETLRAQLTTPPALQLIDVRDPLEYAAGHVASARNIPLAELRGRLSELDAAAVPVFICQTGARSRKACAIAAGAGHARVAQLEGGMKAWAG